MRPDLDMSMGACMIVFISLRFSSSTLKCNSEVSEQKQNQQGFQKSTFWRLGTSRVEWTPGIKRGKSDAF